MAFLGWCRQTRCWSLIGATWVTSQFEKDACQSIAQHQTNVHAGFNSFIPAEDWSTAETWQGLWTLAPYAVMICDVI